MERDKIIDVVGGGRIFSALFTKKDGTDRLMSARLGVRKGVKGIGHKFDPKEKDLLGVFDMNKKEFRFINVKTCKEIRANGQIFK